MNKSEVIQEKLSALYDACNHSPTRINPNIMASLVLFGTAVAILMATQNQTTEVATDFGVCEVADDYQSAKAEQGR